LEQFGRRRSVVFADLRDISVSPDVLRTPKHRNQKSENRKIGKELAKNFFMTKKGTSQKIEKPIYLKRFEGGWPMPRIPITIHTVENIQKCSPPNAARPPSLARLKA
jgi:hypothetical protein